MRHKIPWDQRQREDSTPEAPSDDQRNNHDSEPRWASIPYINGISELLARHLRSHNIKVAHKPTATLRTTLVKAKDAIPQDTKRGASYQFPCEGCNSKYVDEAGKTLNARITQHVAAHNPTLLGHGPPIHIWWNTSCWTGPKQGRQAIHRHHSFWWKLNKQTLYTRPLLYPYQRSLDFVKRIYRLYKPSANSIQRLMKGLRISTYKRAI